MATAATGTQDKQRESPTYIIVTADGGPQTLQRMVNQKIEEGYMPVGGVHSEADYSAYFQAMIMTNRKGGKRKTRRRKTIA